MANIVVVFTLASMVAVLTPVALGAILFTPGIRESLLVKDYVSGSYYKILTWTNLSPISQPDSFYPTDTIVCSYINYNYFNYS